MHKFIISLFLLFTTSFSQAYEVGDIVSPEDQDLELDVCYGGEGPLKLADFNGNLNGGDYKIIFIALSVAS